jgi:hypothetical protein
MKASFALKRWRCVACRLRRNHGEPIAKRSKPGAIALKTMWLDRPRIYPYDPVNNFLIGRLIREFPP